MFFGNFFQNLTKFTNFLKKYAKNVKKNGNSCAKS